MAALTRYINTASSAGGDGTTNGTSGATRAYVSFSEFNTQEAANLTTAGDQMTVNCSGTAADTTGNVQMTGWTTDSGDFVTINGQRTGHTYSTSHYRLEYTTTGSYQEGIRFGEAYTVINDFQMQMTSNNSAFSPYDVVADEIFLNRCISKGVITTGGAGTGIRISSANCGDVYACLAYDFTESGNNGFFFESTSTAMNAYNNTAQNCARGFKRGYNDVRGRNLLAQDCTDGFEATFGWVATTSHNCSDIASDLPGANGQVGDVSFVDIGADDFQPASTDTVAKDNGTDLSGTFDFDLANNAMPATWPIGCLQAAVAAGGTINTVTASDSLVATDSQVMLRLHTREFIDSATVTDAIDVQRLRERLSVDSITVTDSLADQHMLSPRVMSDNISIVDSAIELRQRIRLAIDSVEVLDSLIATLVGAGAINSVTLSDAIDVLDFSIVLRERQRVLLSTIDATDSSIALRQRYRILLDTIDVLDSLIATYVPVGSGTINTRTLSDALAVTDLLFTLHQRIRLAQSVITVADISLPERKRQRIVSDTVTGLIDSLVAHRDRRKLALDTIPATDTSTITIERRRSLLDGVDLVDSLLLLRQRYREIADTTDVIDNIIALYVTELLFDTKIRISSDDLFINIGVGEDIQVPTNLLLSEQAFESADWTNSFNTIITDNADTAPDGTLTAATIEDAAVGRPENINQSVTVAVNNDWYEFSVYVKKTSGGTSNTFGMDLDGTGSGVPFSNVHRESRLNTDTGEVNNSDFSSDPVKADAVGDYWKFIRLTKLGSLNPNYKLTIIPAVKAHGDLTAGDTNNLLGTATIWKAQIHLPPSVAEVVDSAVATDINIGDNL